MLPQNKKQGYFSEFGGSYVPEVLVAPITQLTQAFNKAKQDANFLNEFHEILTNYVGRATPLTPVKKLQSVLDGPQIYLKREDLLHTGAHKINNAIGQCLLAKRLKKTRIIAETGAGQHGVATATACAYLNLDCTIYMGAKDIARQQPNVSKMKLLGANVITVSGGSQTLKDAVNEALRDYAASYENTHYCIGSILGPHPYPEMVAFFHEVIGVEAREQILQQTGRLPSAVIACIGGGSNAIGIFSGFLQDTSVALIGVEGGGVSSTLGEHAARFKQPRVGVLHGTKTYVLQDEAGQIAATHSISAGLDYPAIGPQHAALYKNKRAEYTSVTDDEAVAAFKLLCTTEGIIPALESSHALAYLLTNAAKSRFSKADVVIINLSGRGDKDLPALLARGIL